MFTIEFTKTSAAINIVLIATMLIFQHELFTKLVSVYAILVVSLMSVATLIRNDTKTEN